MYGLGPVTKENHLLDLKRDDKTYFGPDKGAELKEEVEKLVWDALTYLRILRKPMI